MGSFDDFNYRVIYTFDNPVELTGDNNVVVEKYRSADKVNPAGDGNFYFEVAVHGHGKECNKEGFPYDVFVYSTGNGLLFPTNCYTISADEYYPDEPQDETLSHIDARIRDYDIRSWPSKNAGHYLFEGCESLDGINVLQNGTCKPGVQIQHSLPVLPQQETDKCHTSNDGGVTCKFLIFDEASLQNINITPYNPPPAAHFICESEGHLRSQEPINIGVGATDFAFIDGYLIYTHGEKTWALRSSYKEDARTCAVDKENYCHHRSPDKKRLVIKMGDVLFDLPSLSSHGGYAQEGKIAYFVDERTGIRYPQASDRPLLLREGSDEEIAEELLRAHIEATWMQLSSAPPPSLPWWSHLSLNAHAAGSVTGGTNSASFGLFANYYLESLYEHGLNPFGGLGIERRSIDHGKWNDTVTDLGINLGLMWSALAIYREPPHIYMFDKINLKASWGAKKGPSRYYDNITGELTVIRIAIMSLGAFCAVDERFGNSYGFNFDFFAGAFGDKPREYNNPASQTIPETEETFVW